MHIRTGRFNIFLILGLLTIAVVGLSVCVVWLGDDLDYMFRMQGAIWQSWGWIRTPAEFMQSQITHYMNVNGRFFAHALVQLFNGVLGQTTFAIANGFVYAITALLLARLGGSRPLRPMPLLTAIFLLLFGFITKMMPTCQIGYIWGLCINLLWCGIFLSGRRMNLFMICLACLFSLIAGNWNEAYSVGIGGILGVMLLSCWFRHPLRRLSLTKQVMALCYIIGTATVCLAPSTLARAVSVSSSSASLAMVSPPGWLYALLSLRIFYILGGIIIWKRLKGKIHLRSFLYAESFWVSAMMLLFVFNLALGVFGNRQLFGIEMCSAVLIMRLLPRHTFNRFWLVTSLTTVFIIYSWQCMLALEVRRQYEDIHRLFLESENGHVYYDRRRSTSEGFTREAKIYEDIVGLYDNDPHHSMMKYFRHTDPKRRKLLVIPEAVLKTGWRDTVYSYSPGHFIAIGHKGDTLTFRSSVNTFGLETDLGADRKFDFHKSIRGPQDLELIVITPSDPWQVQSFP